MSLEKEMADLVAFGKKCGIAQEIFDISMEIFDNHKWGRKEIVEMLARRYKKAATV